MPRFQEKLYKANQFETYKQYNTYIRGMSPTTFIQLNYHESVPLQEKRKRVSNDAFRVLQYGEHEELCRMNYNVSQLKNLAKAHGLKTSGNKQELLSRVYHYLRLYQYATVIQKYFRRHLVKRFLELRGDAVRNRSLCVNDTDFYTLDDLATIPVDDFMSVTEVTNDSSYTYGFSIESLEEYIQTQKKTHEAHTQTHTIQNPYTRTPFHTDIQKQLSDCIRLGRCIGYTAPKPDPSDTPILLPQTPYQRLKEYMMAIDDMGHLGTYTNVAWFQELTNVLLYKFCYFAHDIWDYRLGLDNATKYEMCGGRNSCLYPYNLNSIRNCVNNRDHMMKIVANLVENLVCLSTNPDLRKSGAMIVMTALTMVNMNARNAFPALYMSIAV